MQGNKHCDYFSCKLFVSWSPRKRCAELIKRKFCLQCLSPGVTFSDPHKCDTKYVCPDVSHQAHAKCLHVLVCERHKQSPYNVDLLKSFSKNFIDKRGIFHDYSRNIALTVSCHFSILKTPPSFNLPNVIQDVPDRAIFLLQTISVDGVRLRIFYDRGAGDAVLKWSAVQALQSLGRAVLVNDAPISMAGVGGVTSVTDYGLWSICLPNISGENVVITGVCMEKVTSEFPEYHLADVEGEIRQKCDTIPKLSNVVGGETDILLGSKYLRFHPREVWRCEESGLTVSDSVFSSVDGSTGVINGPHPKFTEVEDHHWQTRNQEQTHFSYHAQEVLQYRANYDNYVKSSVVGKYDPGLCDTYLKIENVQVTPPNCLKTSDEIENAGTVENSVSSHCKLVVASVSPRGQLALNRFICRDNYFGIFVIKLTCFIVVFIVIVTALIMLKRNLARSTDRGSFLFTVRPIFENFTFPNPNPIVSTGLDCKSQPSKNTSIITVPLTLPNAHITAPHFVEFNKIVDITNLCKIAPTPPSAYRAQMVTLIRPFDVGKVIFAGSAVAAKMLLSILFVV